MFRTRFVSLAPSELVWHLRDFKIYAQTNLNNLKRKLYVRQFLSSTQFVNTIWSFKAKKYA